LGSAFATAASGFDSVVNDGVKALGETIQTTSEALTATVGMLKMLSVYLDEPVLDVEAAIQQARLLGDYARRLASQFATTASGFDCSVSWPARLLGNPTNTFAGFCTIISSYNLSRF
jgi:ABC-type transporter Mla subunit MlaD